MGRKIEQFIHFSLREEEPVGKFRSTLQAQIPGPCTNNHNAETIGVCVNITNKIGRD
jgi:hypothetical protein